MRCRGIRTKRWKYILLYELSPKVEQLFDLDNDPLEQNDLAQNNEFAPILKKMRVKCGKMYQDAK